MSARSVISSAVAIGVAAIAIAGCSPKSTDAGSSSDARVRIVTTQGTIVATLDAAHAPKSVANFLHYVDEKFYDGGTFFRAVPGFVIQGGNKTRESPADVPIALEDPKDTGLHNLDGSLAMARTSDPNSATSEFFIDVGPQPALDAPPGQPGYAVFGQVVSGMDVVRKIVAEPAPGQYLTRPVKIVSISRIK